MFDLDVFVSNTCSIDYYLLALWVLSRLKINILNDIFDLIPLKIIIEFIEKNDWTSARNNWLLNIMQIEKSKIKKGELSLFGSEEEMIIKYFWIHQKHKLVQKCSNNCSENNSIYFEDSSSIFIRKTADNISIFSFDVPKCKTCKTKTELIIQFHKKPKFIFIEAFSNRNIYVKDYPQEII